MSQGKLEQQIHLLQEELTGLREMLAGETQALAGAQRAYAAAAQRADLLEEQLKFERLTNGGGP